MRRILELAVDDTGKVRYKLIEKDLPVQILIGMVKELELRIREKEPSPVKENPLTKKRSLRGLLRRSKPAENPPFLEKTFDQQSILSRDDDD